MKNMVIVGNDKIGKMALSMIDVSVSNIIYIDKSTSIKRIAKLILNKKMTLLLLLRMIYCEFRRSSKFRVDKFGYIKNNKDLIEKIKMHSPSKIVLFRAGLIVNRDVLNLGVPILNIHAAKIPDFGGIGSISAALYQKKYDQYASLHVVTAKIDEGEVLDIEPYQLNPDHSYCKNEFIAYQAGVNLLIRTISGQNF